LHPVISDFNYVVAKINIGDKFFLADATDDFLPFGLLAERCLNGKGRVLSEKKSYWIDLKPADKAKQLSIMTLKLDEDGILRGTIQTTYIGYEAMSRRKKIHRFSNTEEYVTDLDNKNDKFEVKAFTIDDLEELNKPLVQTLTVEIAGFDNLEMDHFLFNPFILGKREENPFRSSQRLYPVDFGTPIEYITLLKLEYPAAFEIVNLPQKTGLVLPNAGGRYIIDVQNTDNKLSFNSSLSITRTLFASHEYQYLKELFARIIQIENGELIFKRKL
jgi:hypothetical protein